MHRYNIIRIIIIIIIIVYIEAKTNNNYTFIALTNMTAILKI